MILQQSQIENILRQISKNMLLYITANIGEAVLSESDRTLLHMFGLAPTDYNVDFPPYYKMYLLGRLTQLLGDENTNKMSYDDFNQYLIKGQYEPLTPFEEIQYVLARQATYKHLKNLENRALVETEESILRVMTRTEYEDIVKEKIETGVKDRKSVTAIISDIGHKTGDWKKDLGRIVDTEMNNIFQRGRAVEISKKNPNKDPLVYKDVYPGACRHCIKLFLMAGVGSEPIVFKMSQLVANGSNIGKKVADWQATIPGTHPWCRCNLRHLGSDQIWDKEKKQFVFDKEALERSERELEARGIKGKIRITVNDKEYVV